MTRHQVEKLRSMMMSKTAIEFLDKAASGETADAAGSVEVAAVVRRGSHDGHRYLRKAASAPCCSEWPWRPTHAP